MNDAQGRRPDVSTAAQARRFDQLCDQFEAQWKVGAAPRLEDFVGGVPADQQPELLGELLALELSYRADRGDRPGTDEYLARFPDHAQTISAELQRRQTKGAHGETHVTALAPQERDQFFGRMALHVGFVRQQALDQALQRQAAEPAKPLAEILVQVGAISAEEQRAVEQLCERHLARHGADPLASLSALANFSTVAHVPLNDTDATLVPTGVAAPCDSTRFGDYQLLGEIARGGMGVVYKARQTRLNRLVALKMIRSGELADAEQVTRFYAEAEAAASLDHPGIVQVHEVGQANGQHFFSMALVAGKSLNDRVKNNGPLPPNLAARLMQTVSEAVQFAHGRGIIHRDIKPQNILLDENDQPRVTDFGLAKQVAGSSELTASGQVMGTPSYMPPEQAKGELEIVGPTSDVYSLGATLYFLLTGRAPFQAASAAETILQVIEVEPVPARRLNPAVPRDLETICLKCLRKEPARRYASAEALAADLGRWLENKPIVARPVRLPERAWLWCKRRPAVATLSAAVVVILVVGSLVAVQLRNAQRAAGLVDSLLTADAEQVPAILRQLDEVAALTRPMLAEKLAQAQEGSKARLHVALALVKQDEQQVEFLYEKLLSSHVSYVGLIREQLAPYQARLQAGLWKLLHDGTQDPARRFRAGLALASYAGNSDHWTPGDMTFLSVELVSANPEHQPRLREYLQPIRERLLGDLERVFADAKEAESHRLGAANALADFSSEDVPRLARLLTLATPDQYAILFPLVSEAKSSAVRAALVDVVRGSPAEDLPPVDRVLLGQRRAGAAITLLRQGERESIFEALRVRDDPESLTQFVHRCRDRGVRPGELLACLDEADRLRQTKTGADRQVEDRVLYGLLLALGEFPLEEVPASERERLIDRVAAWYASDPSSTIHGATGWLLRHWGQVDVARKVDQTPLAYSPDRQWFTLEIKGKVEGFLGIGASEQSTYMTFVVISAGEYMIGSPAQEPERVKDEARHSVRLTYSFALLDREVTWSDFELFDERLANGMKEAIQQQSTWTPKAEEAVGLPNWYDCVRYCRWLTEQTGLSEAEQAYLNPATLDPMAYPPDPNTAAQGAPLNWPLSRLDGPGIRLLTESEWEIAARSGMRTAYGFGGDERLLDRYGWFGENSGKQVHAVRELRPSLVGLFDMHGNVWEWCHDWYDPFDLVAVEDPRGPISGSHRVRRGGGWDNDAALCRSAPRVSIGPTFRTYNGGFRLALSLGKEEEGREK